MISIEKGMDGIHASGLDDMFNELSGNLSPANIISTLRARIGSKPIFHKGRYGKQYDYWTCGNCGSTVKHDVVENYCCNCGYKILWDNPRCLTGQIKEEKRDENSNNNYSNL